MEQHWQQQRPDATHSSLDLEATFLVRRKRSDGDGARIQRLGWDQVGPQEPRVMYALHYGRQADPHVFAAINDTLLVAPASLLPPRQAFVHPRDMLPPPTVGVKAEPAPAPSLLPAKNAAAAAPPAAKPAKRGRLTFAPKKPAVDLRARLDPEIFSAEGPVGEQAAAGRVSDADSGDGDGAAVGDQRHSEGVRGRGDGMDVAQQSFVTFSSSSEGEDADLAAGDDGNPISPADMQIDTACTPVEASDSQTDEPGGRRPPPSLESAPSRMKMIKVPRTFMENGYLSRLRIGCASIDSLLIGM